jgi:hypothetical protein
LSDSEPATGGIFGDCLEPGFTAMRQILADDIHWLILAGNLGQALRAPMVPTWPISRAFGDLPAQGFLIASNDEEPY